MDQPFNRDYPEFGGFLTPEQSRKYTLERDFLVKNKLSRIERISLTLVSFLRIGNITKIFRIDNLVKMC